MEALQYFSGKSTISVEEAKEIIASEDYTPVCQRMMEINGWTQSDVNAALKQYKNYLILKKKYGDTYPLPPSYEIDEVWHSHILHTRHYLKFCQAVFGRYLHHEPHTIEHTNKKCLEEAFSLTQRLYETEFGQPILAIRRKGVMATIKRLYQMIRRL